MTAEAPKQTTCKIVGCTEAPRWWPVINAWPKKGSLRFTVSPPITLGLDIGVCRAHTEFTAQGIRRVDWKHVIQLAKAKGLPAPDEKRSEFTWVDTQLPEAS